MLFTIAAFEAILLRFEYLPIASAIVTNLFILLISYLLMFAIYTRYDCEITLRHYLACTIHSVFFIGLIYLAQIYLNAGYLRSALVLMNIFIPYALTLRKCNQQFKMHRVGDRILYGSLLLTLLIFVVYVVFYALFFSDEKHVPLSLYFTALLSFICILFFGFALSIIYSLVGKLRKEIITDKLTGAKNRNYLTDVAEKMYSLAKRRQEPLSVILCDIDSFKKINDSYGHSAGDKVLVSFSHVIESSLRTEDILIRIGGEEFIILLPYNDIDKALLTAERLRKAINEENIDIGGKNIQISASFGVVQVDTTKSIDDNINHADIALYEAKRSGRNKVIAYSR
ncbi:hypothetical protein NBRC116600_16930 [Thalassotalea sp. SU-HH00458]